MDNIQLYHIDNEINKVDEMKEGDVIYKNGVEGNPMSTVPDGAVAVTLSLAARRGGLPACGDRPSIL